MYYITNQNLSLKVRLEFASFILNRLPLLTSATAGPTDEWESKAGQPHHQHRRRPRQQRLQHRLAGTPWGNFSGSIPGHLLEKNRLDEICQRSPEIVGLMKSNILRIRTTCQQRPLQIPPLSLPLKNDHLSTTASGCINLWHSRRKQMVLLYW